MTNHQIQDLIDAIVAVADIDRKDKVDRVKAALLPLHENAAVLFEMELELNGRQTLFD